MGIVTRLDITDTDFDTAFARLLISPAEADIGLPGTISKYRGRGSARGRCRLVAFHQRV